MHEEVDCIDDHAEQVEPCFACGLVRFFCSGVPVIVAEWMDAGWAGGRFDGGGGLMSRANQELPGGDDEVSLSRAADLGRGLHVGGF